MYAKAFLVALFLGTSCLAAPVDKNEGSMSTAGYGIHKLRAAESDIQETQVLQQRTGYGIVSGNDEA